MSEQILGAFDGIRFKVQFEHGRQVGCVPLCPNCDHPLEQQNVSNDPMLICPSINRGCSNPVMRFATEEGMGKFLTKACEELEKRKK